MILLRNIIITILFCSAAASAQEYQYQYFDKEKDSGKYLPFSDYIPKIRLHYIEVPHYLEDYYQLYGMKQMYDENSLRQNIERLQTALQCNFRHPSQALVKVDSEQEYLKYRKLMFMHINLLIMRNYTAIAARYDKIRIDFYNQPFVKEINESMDIAEKLYKEAVPYWDKAKEYALDASRIKITTDLGSIETERYNIQHGNLDFAKIIDHHIKKIGDKRQQLNSLPQ
jgi:hypothetical protein